MTHLPLLPDLRIELVPPDRPAIFDIRQRVFHEEQGIDPAAEFDGLDAAAAHLLAYVATETGEVAVGTARIRTMVSESDPNSGELADPDTDPKLGKIERLAVLPDWRRRGIGTQLMETAIAYLQQQGVELAIVHAQTYAIPLYEQVGFVLVGKPFEEAGIPHRRLEQAIVRRR